MGVCPQFDILWSELTGLEHMLLYGSVKVRASVLDREHVANQAPSCTKSFASSCSWLTMACAVLQGIPRADVKYQSNVLLSQVQLTSSASVRTGRYSGGMRRRLSVAIALLGACTLLAGFKC